MLLTHTFTRLQCISRSNWKLPLFWTRSGWAPAHIVAPSPSLPPQPAFSWPLCCCCHSKGELPKQQVFCPFCMLLCLALCSSRAAAGESSHPLWFLVFTYNRGWKVSCVIFNRVQGNKGKKPVTLGHKGSSCLPKTTSSAGIPISSWMWWFRKSSR